MMEKLLLAATITFSLTLFAGVPTQSKSSVLTATSTASSGKLDKKPSAVLLISKLIETQHAQ